VADPTVGPDRIETEADLEDGDAGLWAYWLGQDRIAGKDEDKWHKRGRKIVARYRDERPSGGNSHRLNLLWSNVQTLIPTLYARTPKPDVQRRWLDQDDTGRLASVLLERAVAYSLDSGAFDEVMLAVVQDRLLPGRGVARVMYVPHFGDAPEPEAFEDEEAAPSDIDNPGDEPAEPEQVVVYEEAIATYVFWEDYREGPARTWREVPWVRYRAYMNRDELLKRFGKEKGKQVNLDYTPKGAQEENDKAKEPPDIFKKAEIYEFWDKIKKRVVWLAPGTPDLILDDIDDPLGLPDFFPSPDPLLATTTTSKRIPVPDYVEYQDQANELDTLTARIDTLTRSLKMSGVYPASLKQSMQQLVDEGSENKLIPVEDWAMLADKGGLQNAVMWFPIKEVADTLIQLYAARDKTKDLLYEITGIGDIMRGETNPNETMGAQQLKANFSTRRILPQQRAVARVARDLIRLLAGVISEHFSSQTISMITGYPVLAPVPPVPPEPPAVIPPPPGAPMPPVQPGQMPQPGGLMPNPAHAQWQQAQQASMAVQQANMQKQQQFEAACALIRKDGVRGFKLDIEADSTIAPDEQQEQANRTDFTSKIVPLMENVIPLAQGNPAIAAMAKEIVLFAVRGFRVARQLEESIEGAFDSIAKMPPTPPKGATHGTAQNPQIEQAKIQADVHDSQLKAQTEQQAIAQKAQQAADELQIAREKSAAEDQHNQADLALRAAELHQRGQLEMARTLKTESSSTQGMV
jgi:hypothetical protein